MAADSVPKCLICSKPAVREAKHYPFCSERCRTVDLGNWVSGRYVISRPLTEADEHFQPGEEASED